MTSPVFVASVSTVEPAGVLAAAESGSVLTLTGQEARHAVSVRRLRQGEAVDLVDGHGLRLRCEVVEVSSQARQDRLGVRVVERVEEPGAHLRLALVQALAKGGRDEQAVETATEVGVDLVVPWQAERSVSVWKGARLSKGHQRWRSTAHQAAKQSRRARFPDVEEARTTRQLCTWVGEVVRDGGVVLVLHEEGTSPLSSARLPQPVPSGARSCPPVLAVVVGPEGGISAEERTALEHSGAMTVRLGPHVMRSSSAGPVALAVLAQRAGLWD